MMGSSKKRTKFSSPIIFLVVVTGLGIIMMGNVAQGATIYLQDIDSGLTSPQGNYRWLDVADQQYSSTYQNSYNYTQANVVATYNEIGDTLEGTLIATNLKPNFAYQLKLTGTPGMADNERIGLGGRWWQEEWDGSEWANGQNLNDKGDGSSPNPNDITYFARRDITDPTSPTGLKYRYTGYLVFDYFITDENGDATLNFETDSCYHVLWKTTQRSHTGDDGPIKSKTFNPDTSSPAYDVNYPEQTVAIFGEWERLPVGGVFLQSGDYENVQMIITEESFHGSGLAGGWAAAMGTDISFTIEPDEPNQPPNTPSTPSGPSSGNTGAFYSYSTSATDPDGDQVKYTFDWGDGATSETGFVNSGTSASRSHTWSSAGTYYVKAKATDSKDTSSGWSGSKSVTITNPNNPPNTPSNPSPSNHATDQSSNADLSWTGGDPDAGDTVTYDVYFGVSTSPPLVSNDQSGTTYDIGTLNYNTKYYWKIIATDNHGASTSGTLWDFTTYTSDPCDLYDTNGTPGIQKDEAVAAIGDYLIYYTIDKATAVAVLNCYFFG